MADLRHGQIIRSAAHGDRDVQASRADGEHARRAAGGRVAVRAEQGLAGHGEALQVDLVADAVAGSGEPDAVLCRDSLDVLVVVRILAAGLEHVVVYVRD